MRQFVHAFAVRVHCAQQCLESHEKAFSATPDLESDQGSSTSFRFTAMARASSIGTAPVNFQARPDGQSKEAFPWKRGSLCIETPHRCLQIKAIINNQKAPNDFDNEKSTSERTRAVLERLFAQSQKLQQESDPRSEKNEGFDLDIASVKMAVEEAIEALHFKEEELKAAENNVRAEVEKLKRTRFNLLLREKKLEVASHTHSRIQEELISAKERSAEQALELQELGNLLSQREKEVMSQQASIDLKIDELGVLNREVLQKEAGLSEAEKELEERNSRLTKSRDFISKQASQLGELRNALEKQGKSLAFAEKEKLLQQERHSKAKAELEQRSLGFLKVQHQLKGLKQDVTLAKSAKEVMEKNLRKCETLLSEVHEELDSSRKEIQNFHMKLKMQEMENRKQKDKFSYYKLLLSSSEKELIETQKKLNAEKEQHNSTQILYQKVKEEWDEWRHQALDMKEKLEEQKQELHFSLEEVRMLRIDLQQKDSGLSDTELVLQLKGAELVSTKMEMQQLSSEFSLNQLLLKDKTVELEDAQRKVRLLHNEVFQLSTSLQAKECQLAKVILQLNEKEDQLKSTKATLDNRTVRLLEVTSVIEEIASLSQTLANAVSPSIAATQKETQLMRANYKLFTASRENLGKDIEILNLTKKLESVMKNLEAEEAELEALKESLRLKDVELLHAQKDLGDKDKEMNKVIQNWKVREAELKTLRQHVVEEANGLIMLHSLAQTQTKPEDVSPAEVAIENLQLEATKLNEDATLCALQSLAELAEELVLVKKRKVEELNFQKVVPGQSAAEQLPTEAVTATLLVRESALEATRCAVENLLNLTTSLTNVTELELNLATDTP